MTAAAQVIYAGLMGRFRLIINGQTIEPVKVLKPQSQILLEWILLSGKNGLKKEIVQEALCASGKETDTAFAELIQSLEMIPVLAGIDLVQMKEECFCRNEEYIFMSDAEELERCYMRMMPKPALSNDDTDRILRLYRGALYLPKGAPKTMILRRRHLQELFRNLVIKAVDQMSPRKPVTARSFLVQAARYCPHDRILKGINIDGTKAADKKPVSDTETDSSLRICEDTSAQ